jgi:hypothetical protein
MKIGQLFVISAFFVALSVPALAADKKPAPKKEIPAAAQEASAEEAMQAANIEPAAGGDTTSCWGQAIDKASKGIRTTLNYGDTVESQLAGAASCDK